MNRSACSADRPALRRTLCVSPPCPTFIQGLLRNLCLVDLGAIVPLSLSRARERLLSNFNILGLLGSTCTEAPSQFFPSVHIHLINTHSLTKSTSGSNTQSALSLSLFSSLCTRIPPTLAQTHSRKSMVHPSRSPSHHTRTTGPSRPPTAHTTHSSDHAPCP